MPAIDPIIRIAWSSAGAPGRSQNWDDALRQRILSWEYTDKARGADEGRLSLDNFDLSLFDHEALKANNTLWVQWGYPFALFPVRSLKIKKIKGFRTLNIEGTAADAAQMMGPGVTRAWVDATPFEVATEIANEMGFTDPRTRVIEAGDVEVVRSGISQAGESNLAFLLRLAGAVGCTFYVSGGVFHFHEPAVGSLPTKTLTYWTSAEGQFLGDPDIDHDVKGRPGRTERRGVSPRDRARIEGSASNREDRRRPVLGEELATPDPSTPDVGRMLRDLGIESAGEATGDLPSAADAQTSCEPVCGASNAEAASQARRRFRGGERASLKLSAAIVGDPTIQAGTTITVEGIGQKYSGNYYIEEAVHSVGTGGYQTKLTMNRNGTSRSRGTGRARQRTERQAVAGVRRATGDIPVRSELCVCDTSGRRVTTRAPEGPRIEQRTEVDPDGNERTRFHLTGPQPTTRLPEPWEEGF